MEFHMKSGDTNFIGIANPNTYRSFVDEDWELEGLLRHFGDEMKDGHLLVCQMTEEGIEHSWKVDVRVDGESPAGPYLRRAEGFLEVTEGSLYLVDYDCLTMAAQFEDEEIPDRNCSQSRIELENGRYRVEIVQFYDVDQDKRIGTEECDLIIHFTPSDSAVPAERVFWCTYCS